MYVLFVIIKMVSGGVLTESDTTNKTVEQTNFYKATLKSGISCNHFQRFPVHATSV